MTNRSLRRIIFRLDVLAAAALLAACGGGDSTSPTSKPAFAVVAGMNATDTVGATLTQALVVEIRDDHGNPRGGVVVRFDAVPTTDTTRRTEAAVSVARLAGTTFSAFTSDTTDAAGRAKGLVRLGTVAGDARIVVTAPELGTRDTARFTVLPGAAAKLVLPIRDTAVFVGGSFSLSAAIADRLGNRRTGAVDITPGPAIASVDATGRVTAGSTPGRGYVVVRAGAAIDTAKISVVPRGTLVVLNVLNTFPSTPYAVATVELDGSGYRSLATTTQSIVYPKWAPGDRIIFHEGGDSFTGAHIFTVDLTGKRQPLLPATTDLASDLYGRFSPDGNWVYLSGRRSTDGNFTLFRVHPDGTGLETTTPIGFTTSDVAWRGDPSPDASKLVYVFTGTQIRVMDIASRAVTNLGVIGQFPQWSPDGQFIAYTDQFSGRLRIIRANGTEQRIVTTGQTYGEGAGFGFSSDGQWIVIRGPSALDLVNVSSGAIIPLPYSRSYFQPSFKP